MNERSDKDVAELPDEPPEQLADELVLELGDMAIDVIQAQIEYWTKALEEARQQLSERDESEFI